MPNSHDDFDEPSLRIGPGADPTDPTDLMARARAEAKREQEEHKLGVQLARRLIVAFIVCLLIGAVCFAILPGWLGVTIPPWVPVLSFIAIMLGALLTAAQSEPRSDGNTKKPG